MDECPIHIRIRFTPADRTEQSPRLSLNNQQCICHLLQQLIFQIPPPTHPPQRHEPEYEREFERIVELDSWDEAPDGVVTTRNKRNVVFKAPDNIIHHETSERHHEPRHSAHRKSSSHHSIHHKKSHSDHKHHTHNSEEHSHAHDICDRKELKRSLHKAPFVIPKVHIKAPSKPIPPHIRTIPKLIKQTIRHLPARRPTIYIVTFSKNKARTAKGFDDLLNRHLPRSEHGPMPFLYLIDASGMKPPPDQLCENYSGLSPIIQDYVMRDPRAQRAVKRGVFDLVDFCKKERLKEWEGGRKEVAMSVCCIAGTHRSVAIAELIAAGVKDASRTLGWDEGVRVVVKHVHREQGLKEAI